MLRSEIQAELEIAFTTAELSQEAILESIDSFLAQDDDWQPTEEYLREYAEEHPQQSPPGAKQLTSAAPYEVAAWREAWRGNYDEASSAAQRAAAALNHPTMNPYRAWWLPLAASWSVIADGPEAGRTVALSREADLATRRLPWRPPLNALSDDRRPSRDDALALRAGKATHPKARSLSWLRRSRPYTRM